MLDNESQPHQKRRRKRKKQKKNNPQGDEEGSQPDKRGKLDEDSQDSLDSHETESCDKRGDSENITGDDTFESQEDEMQTQNSLRQQTNSSNGTRTGRENSSGNSELKSPTDSAMPTEDSKTEVTREVHASRTEGHRAGFDSFMTGFIFTQFIAKHGRFRGLPESPKLTDLGMQDFSNKVALSGKDIPLQIMKSIFAKTSKDHQEKMDKIRLLYASSE